MSKDGPRTETIKDPFNCETGMRGTDTSRPTVAYSIQVDSINISN